MSLWAIVPVKSFARAKARLSPALTDGERASLSHTMFQRIIGTLRACRQVGNTMVATDCDEVERIARNTGAYVIRDEPEASLAQVVDAAVDGCRGRGATATLVAMADLPFIELRDVERLLQLPTRAPLVVAPDRVGAGTNALLLRDLSLATQFGNADSYRRHLGLAPIVASFYSHGLAFDIDEPGDLRAARLVAEAVVSDELVVGAENGVRVRDTVQR